ncbi:MULTISPECIES: ribonuclease inhibitor [Chryseobacterium group]|uniref:ribonuclease inhibitor n=1 Tax=Chryseobacterium group TaxID=2782232 RepID=UPI000B4C2A15|nr:ribonuclease inhibitor [Chryseobacterium sp. VAUSW3]OWR13329.1 ribonuclease inhibitor [Chryseobacterium sp. VAUSW3]
MKKIIIEGKNINNIETFYEEVNRVFMSQENWKIAQSLDAFNDLLYGSFGEIKGKEKIQLIWKDIEENQKSLGFQTTLEFYQNKLKSPEIFNRKFVLSKIDELHHGVGLTFFEIILEIISDHDNITVINN